MDSSENELGADVVGKFSLVQPVHNQHVGYKVPYPRSGHCSVTDGTNLYVFGGYHPRYQIPVGNPDEEDNHEVFQELWCFNLDTKIWTEVETTGEPPRQTASMSMTLAGSVLLFFGGTCFPWGSISNNKIYMLNLRDKRWSVLQVKGDKPPRKYGQAILLKQNQLFVYGGCRQVSEFDFLFDSDLHMLNLQSQTWCCLSNVKNQTSAMIEARGMYRHGLAQWDNRIYIVGSSWSELYTYEHNGLDKLHAFNLDKMDWELVEITPSDSHGCPSRRVYHSCVQTGSDVYICGGHNNHTIFDDVWRLSLSDLRWTKLPAVMPVACFFHAAAITPAQCMYIFGGVTCLEDRVRTSAVYKIWLKMPPLLELCWKTVLSHIPNIHTVSKEYLGILGIPRHLVDRLKPA